MKIAFHPYTLKAQISLNTLTNNRERHGALIRVTFANGTQGYADMHPWEELGDLPLTQQHMDTPLAKRSLYFAKIDAEARLRGVNVFDGLTIPKSHLLVTNEKDLEKMGNFTHFKLKAKKELIPHLPGNIRIDFNCTKSPETFLDFMQDIPVEKIDFCEDPFPYNEISWKKTALPLACDLGSEKAIGTKHTLVIKPAVQAIEPFLQTTQPLVITSYMDHPLGQLGAAYIAAKHSDRVGVCGLLTHNLYENNPFSEQLSINGSRLIPPEGTGFGFDKLLTNITWHDSIKSALS